MSVVEIAREGEVAVLRLNRPEKLNAISSEVERALHDALAGEVVRSSSAVVVAGEGRAFSAGADISEFEGRSPEDVLRYYHETGGVYEELAALPQPTIAAIHGYCLGGALELAVALDFRIADETAVFGFPEVSLGILASSGGLHRVTRLLGPARAKELFLLAERFGADEARRAGIVTEVVEEGKALQRALEVAVRLAALPRDAVAVTKQAIDAASESPREAALLIERLAYAALAQTQAAKDAAAGFGELTLVVHEKEVEIRWRDLDSFDHVNHVVFLTYLEEARDEWLGRVLEDPALVWGYVIARVEIDYRRELRLEDDVVIARCLLDRLGTKSVVTNESIVTRDGEISAEAKAVLVARDPETGQSRVISDDERAAFERAAPA